MKNIKLNPRIIKSDGKIRGNYVKGKAKETLTVELTFEEAKMIALHIWDVKHKADEYLDNFCLKCETKKQCGSPEKIAKIIDREIKRAKTNRRISKKLTKMFWPWAKYDW